MKNFSFQFILPFLFLTAASCYMEPTLTPNPNSLDQRFLRIKEILHSMNTQYASKITEATPSWTAYSQCRINDFLTSCSEKLETFYISLENQISKSDSTQKQMIEKWYEELYPLEAFEERLIGRKIKKNFPSLLGPYIFTEFCEDNSVTISQTDDFLATSILFSDMQLEGLPRTIFKKRCNATIQIKVPRDKKAALFKIDYRGFSQLPKGANALFRVDYSNENNRRIKPFKRLLRENESGFLYTDRIPSRNFQYYSCGENISLSLTTEITLENNSTLETALASLDSADGSSQLGGVSFGIKMVNCR